MVAGSLSAEVTPVQSTNYSGQELYEFDELVNGFGNVYIFETENITGLPKFDPSLGTLQEIRLSVTGSANIEIALFSGSIEDESQLFTAYFDPDLDGNSSTSVDVGLFYSPSGENVGYGIGLEFYSPPSLGFEDEDPQNWTFDSTFYFDDYVNDDFFFYDGVDESPLQITLAADDPTLNLDDFVG